MNQRRFHVAAITLFVMCVLWQVSFSTSLPTFAQAAPTPSPTPSKPLSEQAGFSDPELARMQTKGLNIVTENIQLNANGHIYRLLTLEHDVQEFDVRYGAVLLYQMDGDVPQLKWSTWNDDHCCTYSITDPKAPSPGDWNKGGKTFFAVYRGISAISWDCCTINIYEITPEGKVASRLEGVIPEGFIVLEIAYQADQSLLITTIDVQNELTMASAHCCGPSVARYYEWRNDKIFNASIRHFDKYSIKLIKTIAAWTGPSLGDSTPINEYAIDAARDLLELLMIYDALKQREAGWQLVKYLVAEAKRTNRLADGTYIDLEFMPAMEQFYKQNKLFAAPETLKFGRSDN